MEYEDIRNNQAQEESHDSLEKPEKIKASGYWTKVTSLIDKIKSNNHALMYAVGTIALIIILPISIAILSPRALEDTPPTPERDTPIAKNSPTATPSNKTSPTPNTKKRSPTPTTSPTTTLTPSPTPTSTDESHNYTDPTPTTTPIPTNTPAPTPTPTLIPTPTPLSHNQDPVVTGVTPSSFKEGDRVTITGNYFGENHLNVDRYVNFNCNNAVPRPTGEITSWTDTQITFTVPAKPYECQWTLACGYNNHSIGQFVHCMGDGGGFVKETTWFDWTD